MTSLLKVHPHDLAGHALAVGDPHRAAAAAELLDDVEEVGYYRAYRTFTDTYCGKHVSISSHGVGASGASICYEELMQRGITNRTTPDNGVE